MAHYSVFPISISGQGEVTLFIPFWRRLWNGLSFSESGSRTPPYDQTGRAMGRLGGVWGETSGARIGAVADTLEYNPLSVVSVSAVGNQLQVHMYPLPPAHLPALPPTSLQSTKLNSWCKQQLPASSLFAMW